MPSTWRRAKSGAVSPVSGIPRRPIFDQIRVIRLNWRLARRTFVGWFVSLAIVAFFRQRPNTRAYLLRMRTARRLILAVCAGALLPNSASLSSSSIWSSTLSRDCRSPSSCCSVSAPSDPYSTARGKAEKTPDSRSCAIGPLTSLPLLRVAPGLTMTVAP